MILPPLVFPALSYLQLLAQRSAQIYEMREAQSNNLLGPNVLKQKHKPIQELEQSKLGASFYNRDPQRLKARLSLILIGIAQSGIFRPRISLGLMTIWGASFGKEIRDMTSEIICTRQVRHKTSYERLTIFFMAGCVILQEVITFKI